MKKIKINHFSSLVFIISFISSIVISISISYYDFYYHHQQEIAFIQEKGKEKLGMQSKQIEHIIDSLEEYTIIIAKALNQQNNNQAKLSIVLKKHFFQNIGMFQIRLLNSSGIEQINYKLIDSHIIEQIKLQDKSNRYYYQESKNLALDDIYISRIDLNMENNQIEKPYKNMIRMIKKIKIDQDIYFLVINYDISNVLKYILKTTLYDIFLVEKDNQINMHLNNKYAFSKQKKLNIYLKDIMDRPKQYIAQKNINKLPYALVISIKDSRLNTIENSMQHSIQSAVLFSIVLTLIFSTILFYILKSNLNKFNIQVLKIINNKEESQTVVGYQEFDKILEQIRIQQNEILMAQKIIEENVIYTKTDVAGIVTYASSAFCDISGYTSKEICGKPHNLIRHKDMPQSMYKDLWETIKKGESWKGSIKNNAKNGSYYWIETSIESIFNHDGSFNSYIAIKHDITSKVALDKLNYELEQRIDDEIIKNTKQFQILQEQSKMAQMGEMIGAIAHQWRQPLNEISTGIQNLKYDYKEGLLDDEKYIKTFIDKNKKTISFMSHTIDDFRNFFRVEKNKIEFDVLDATKKVIEMQSAQLKDHNIVLHLNGEKFNFIGLESEYQQVILNIISNAKDVLLEKNIKNPIIIVEVKSGVVTIEDNARGVPQDILDRIFEPYFTTKEQGKGTGLGLYMSKMIIEDNMGGELSVTNVDNGARFVIDLNINKGREI